MTTSFTCDQHTNIRAAHICLRYTAWLYHKLCTAKRIKKGNGASNSVESTYNKFEKEVQNSGCKNMKHWFSCVDVHFEKYLFRSSKPEIPQKIII